ncbi:MAG: beta strand repeat-containing protein, partial [Dolichospermum sp.]
NDIADNASTLYLRIVGYNGSTPNGVLRIDNLTILANTWNENANLILSSSTSHGTGLSSGGTFMPTYGSFYIDINASNYVETTTNVIFNGTLNIENGNFRVSSPATSIIFHTSDIPLQRTNGTFTIASGASLSFGSSGNTGGAAFAIPNNLFTATSFSSLTINRTNALTLGNQSFVLSGNLALTSGTLNDNGNTITIGANITGTGTHSSTSSGALIMTGSGGSISGATLGNLTLNNAGGFSLTGSPTIAGTLSLSDGALAIGSNTLTFRTANVPLTRGLGSLTTTTSSNLVFGTSGNTGGNAFIIPDNTFTSAPDFNNFTVNRTNSLTLNNQNFTLRGILTLTSGLLVLPSNHLFTLKSTSIINTALVAQVGGTVQYNTGSAFLVERFIPQLRRALRDIAPAVNSGTGTFFTNWQESAVNNNGFGTHITGLAGTIGSNDATTGFDMTLSGNRSLSSYNINTGTGAAAWTNYTSTRGSNDTLSAYKGYRLTIRGNRAYDLSVDNTLMNANTILRSRGQLITGTVTYNTSGVTGNATTNTNIRLNFASATGFTMIGNPYVSPIDWVAIAANASNNNVEDTYWVFDPTVGTVGAYVTYNSLSGSSNLSSNVNQYIQPGQAFFIRNNNSVSPTFVIRESDKATSTANLTSVFNTNNTQISSMYFTLEKKINNSFTQMDAAKFCLNDQFNNLKGSEDASKISNETENLSIINFGSQLSIDGRKNISVNDSIRLRVRQTSSSANYLLKINLSSFNVNGFNYFLRDRFTKTTTPLTMLTNEYAFTTTSDTNSFNDRFTIVFNNASPLPVSFTNIKATKVATGNKIEWKVIQTNASHFQVQHSTNGSNFENIGTISANSLNGSEVSYSFLHTSPISGTNYYRIVVNDKDGKTS